MNHFDENKITQCPNGHFYSGVKYDSCPYCNPNAGAPQQNQNQGGFVNVSSNSQTVPVGFNQNQSPMNGATVPVSPMNSAPNNSPSFGGNANQGSTVPATNSYPNAPTSRTPSYTQVSDENVTVAKWGGSNPSKPEKVVGWLVATEGVHEGEDFRIKAGRNFIGRDRSMDICLKDDNSISRNKHCIITFDPKSRGYLVQPGDTHELSYLNNDIILESMKLKAYDKLVVGNSVLMFVPLCGDEFMWEF